MRLILSATIAVILLGMSGAEAGDGRWRGPERYDHWHQYDNSWRRDRRRDWREANEWREWSEWHQYASYCSTYIRDPRCGHFRAIRRFCGAHPYAEKCRELSYPGPRSAWRQ